MNKLEIFKNGSKINELRILDKYKEIAKILIQKELFKYKVKIKHIYNTNNIEIKMYFTKELFDVVVKYEYKYFFENVEF